jgi:NAD+ diphosphatase
MSFSAQFEPGITPSADHWVIVVINQRLLVRQSGRQILHRLSDVGDLSRHSNTPIHLGLWSGQSCFVISAEEDTLLTLHDFDLSSLRGLLDSLDSEGFAMAGRALQLLHWQSFHRFCGCCGATTRPLAHERVLQCSQCEALFYPRISPCVIGIIVDGERCLLARNANFRDGRFSTIAGFIEPGETAEAALQREIMEEVGVEVDRLEYITSQPWPFPSQLMLGFVAHYRSGEVRVDGVEIVEARWFEADDLPLLPPPQTISGMLIATFLNRVRP